MLAGSVRSGGSNWQKRDQLLATNSPLKAPSANLPTKHMPSTNFEPTYQYQADSPNKLKAFKVEEEQGRVRVVSQFSQGFARRGAERYPAENGDGFETYVGTYGDGRRHGVGAFHDKDGGITQSLFKGGRPYGEGTKLANGSLYRTHGGVVDGGAISHHEAAAIAKNSGLPEPPSDYASQILRAHTPLPGAKRREALPNPPPQPATDYTTEAKSAFAGNLEGYGRVHSVSFLERPGTSDTFLARMASRAQSIARMEAEKARRMGSQGVGDSAAAYSC